MLAQAATGLPGVQVRRNGKLAVDTSVLTEDAVVDSQLNDASWTGATTFLSAIPGRRRPIKLQLTGPVTLGLALLEGGAPASVAFPVASAAVAACAASLLERARRQVPHAGIVVFLDEPGLLHATACGLPLTSAEVVDLASGALASMGPDVVSGLHSCGQGDWRVALQAGPDILSIPVDDRLVDDAGAVASYLEGGGWVAWGAVPTDRPIGDDPDVLWRRLVSLWCDLARAGCDPALLRRQALISPACGLAHHGVSQAEWVLRLCRRIGERVEDQAVAARLSIGA